MSFRIACRPYAMYEWYHRVLGANALAANLGGELPGVMMRYGSTPLPTEPTKGRAVDHIGFEVKNLDADVLCQEAAGERREVRPALQHHPPQRLRQRRTDGSLWRFYRTNRRAQQILIGGPGCV